MAERHFPSGFFTPDVSSTDVLPTQTFPFVFRVLIFPKSVTACHRDQSQAIAEILLSFKSNSTFEVVAVNFFLMHADVPRPRILPWLPDFCERPPSGAVKTAETLQTARAVASAVLTVLPRTPGCEEATCFSLQESFLQCWPFISVLIHWALQSPA